MGDLTRLYQDISVLYAMDISSNFFFWRPNVNRHFKYRKSLRKSLQRGKLIELRCLVEQKAYHDQGTCILWDSKHQSTYCRAMGFQLPGAAFTPSNGLARKLSLSHSLRI